MSRHDRRAAEAATLTTQGPPSRSNVVRATVAYGIAGSPTTISLQSLQFARAERTFPADCGVARARLGSPELHFAQLDPDHDDKIIRVVLVRYERHRFVERAKSNESFRLELEKHLTASGRRGEPGQLSNLFVAAKAAPDSMSALLDAEVDLCSYSGGRGGMVFLALSQNEIASALVSKSAELWFTPELEVTMTIALLADLLLSWKNLAETLQSTSSASTTW